MCYVAEHCTHDYLFVRREPPRQVMRFDELVEVFSRQNRVGSPFDPGDTVQIQRGEPLQAAEAGGERCQTIPSKIEHVKTLQVADVTREAGQQQVLGVQFLQPFNA